MRKQHFTGKRERGQAIIVAFFLMMVVSGTVVILYNTGQVTSEKARLVNAADAAAYSGSVFMARNLNFMAYTNRAMVTNHLAVGHIISYISWVEMVDDSTDKFDEVENGLEAIPYIGEILSALLQISLKATSVIAPIILKLAQTFASGFVPLVEITNNGLFRAQQAASAHLLSSTISAGTMNDLMNKTAKEYNKEIKILGIEEMATAATNSNDTIMTAQIGVIVAQAGSDFKKVQGFLKSYDASDDDGRIKKLTLDSIGKDQEWIEDRDTVYNAVVVPVIKKGSTELKMDGTSSGDTDWEAEDTMNGGIMGEGEEKATDHLSSYSGVPGYYDIKEIDSPKNQTLPLTVYATMPFKQARIFRLLGMKASPDTEFSTVSRAEVYHQRPEDTSKFKSIGKHGEYPNVFNPFWEARLIKSNDLLTF